jgi:hypothetical protein
MRDAKCWTALDFDCIVQDWVDVVVHLRAAESSVSRGGSNVVRERDGRRSCSAMPSRVDWKDAARWAEVKRGEPENGCGDLQSAVRDGMVRFP